MHDLPLLHKKIFRILDVLLHSVIVVTSLSLILLMTFYVFSRYVIKFNFRGFEEIAILIAVWLYFCGSANACREQSQISADMLDMFVKNKTIVSGITVFYRIVGLVIVALLTYLCWDFLKFNLDIGTKSSLLKIPMYCYHASLLIGFGLMFLYDFCYFVASVQEFVARLRHTYAEPAAEEEET